MLNTENLEGVFRVLLLARPIGKQNTVILSPQCQQFALIYYARVATELLDQEAVWFAVKTLAEKLQLVHCPGWGTA